MNGTHCGKYIAAGTLLVVLSGALAMADLVDDASSPDRDVFSPTEFSTVVSDAIESRIDGRWIVDLPDLNVSGLLSIWSPPDLDSQPGSLSGPAGLTLDPALLVPAPAGSPVLITIRDDRTGSDRVQAARDQVGSAELDVGTGLSGAVVPEPSVLVLMLLGLPVLVRTRRKYATNR